MTFNMRKIVFALSALALMFAPVACSLIEPDNDETDIPSGAVDLGIVITREDGTTYNLYWAKSNLSMKGLCANPYDYGDYYAWGETAPKGDYSWYAYKYGEYPHLTKYNTKEDSGTVDNRTVLNPEDDVAHVKLGGKWRMPTIEEWDALVKQCHFTLTTQNDVNGQLVTGPNGNSIFLPAAGWREYDDLDYPGSTGSYWSSSLHPNYQNYACSGTFNNGGYVGLDMTARCIGLTIRPVSE